MIIFKKIVNLYHSSQAVINLSSEYKVKGVCLLDRMYEKVNNHTFNLLR